MKSRLLIIIVIGIIGITSVGLLITIDYSQKFNYPPSQLQLVLDSCNDTSTMDKTLEGYEFFNDTHYINNNLCKWQKIGKYPNTDINCIPGQDTGIGGRWTNGTHVYHKRTCQLAIAFSWDEEWSRSTIDSVESHKRTDKKNGSLLK